MSIVKIIRRKFGKGVAGIKPWPYGSKAVKVGFPAGEADSDVIMRATYNNFGTSRIPERPFMQNAMRDNRASYREAMKKGAVTIIRAAARGDDPAAICRTTLRKLGIKAKGDIQAEIGALQTPPNAPSTIRQKGSANPLIDTGEMRRSVSYKIEE